jgi:hypothetical protein
MKFMDPLNVSCPVCDTRQLQRVADLLSFSAVCTRCAAPLDNVGRSMHKSMKEVGDQINYVVFPLIDLEEQLAVPFPDDGGWDRAKTKAELVGAIVAYLSAVAPEKADPNAISAAYDQSLIRHGHPLPVSDSAPLF